MNGKRPFVIGLTGSIGTGKTTTARMFRDLGIPVWDADEAVRRLYEPGSDLVAEVARDYPDLLSDGKIDRAKLKHLIDDDPDVLSWIEARVHPRVKDDRTAFIEQTEDPIVVLDIPLLFETGADKAADFVLVVSIDPETQRDRVLSRGDMTAKQFEFILSRQMPDTEKRQRADLVIETSSVEHVRQEIEYLLNEIRGNHIA